MDFISFLIFFGICVGVFLGLLLISLSRGNKSANRLLGILLLTFSISITGFLLERTGTIADYPFLIGLSQLVLFLFGPLFYFYVKVLTKRKFSLREQHYLHFLPFLFLLIYKVPFLIKSGAEKLAVIHEPSFRLENIAILALQIIHLFVYIYFTNKLILKHENKIKSTMSSIDKINLRWLNMGIYFFAAVFGMMFVFTLLFFSGIDLFYIFNVLVPLCVSFIISMMGYYGLKQPIIFPAEEEKQSEKKYKKSKLNDALSEEYLQRLLCYMEQEKPYLQNNLTLQKLAMALGITHHHLSQIINEKQNQNFFDFINQYRVKEAQRILQNPQGQLLTILAISEEVGFNSKTAFNTAFRKTTNMTPSEFRKMQS
jgi:AraC-like DNA-binding protein